MKYKFSPQILEEFSKTKEVFNSHIINQELFKRILSHYGNRKIGGRLDLIVDVTDNSFYPVPRNIEHSKFASFLSEDLEKLIPSQYRFEEDKLVEIITGASSFEDKYRVTHERKDLVEAHNFMLTMANYLNLDLELRRNEILWTYLKVA